MESKDCSIFVLEPERGIPQWGEGSFKIAFVFSISRNFTKYHIYLKRMKSARKQSQIWPLQSTHLLSLWHEEVLTEACPKEASI